MYQYNTDSEMYNYKIILYIFVNTVKEKGKFLVKNYNPMNWFSIKEHEWLQKSICMIRITTTYQLPTIIQRPIYISFHDFLHLCIYIIYKHNKTKNHLLFIFSYQNN